MRGSLLDLTPVRTSGAFRRLWIGSSVNVLGGQPGAFAVLLCVWQLTGDPFWVGVAGSPRSAGGGGPRAGPPPRSPRQRLG